MLSCGSVWKPTSVNRVIKNFPTSTRVSLVATDQGTAYLKGMGNPAGNESLASELVGTELAALVGLRVPPFAIVPVSEIEILMEECGYVEDGPAFVSSEIRGATSDGGNYFLSRLSNGADVALLIMFDTWVRNGDRCPPPNALDPTPRHDNLFFRTDGRKFELTAFDHTHCFVEADLDSGLIVEEFEGDERIFGLFPEFVPYLTEQSLRRAVGAIRNVDPAAVEEIVHSVPLQWGPSNLVRNRWIDCIVGRSKVMPDRIMRALMHQGGLNFED